MTSATRPLSENRIKTLDSAEQIPADIMREAQYLARYAVAGLPFVTDADLEAQVSFSAPRIADALLACDKRAAHLLDVLVDTFARCQIENDWTALIATMRDAILNHEPTPAVSSPGCGTSEAPASASYSQSAGINGTAPSAETAGDEASRPTVSAHPIPPGTHFSAAADGQPSIPSSVAAGAKREGAFVPPPSRGDTSSRHSNAKAEQAVTYSSSRAVRRSTLDALNSGIDAGTSDGFASAPAESACDEISAPYPHSSRHSSSATNADDATILPASSAPIPGDA